MKISLPSALCQFYCALGLSDVVVSVPCSSLADIECGYVEGSGVDVAGAHIEELAPVEFDCRSCRSAFN